LERGHLGLEKIAFEKTLRVVEAPARHEVPQHNVQPLAQRTARDIQTSRQPAPIFLFSNLDGSFDLQIGTWALRGDPNIRHRPFDLLFGKINESVQCVFEVDMLGDLDVWDAGGKGR